MREGGTMYVDTNSPIKRKKCYVHSEKYELLLIITAFSFFPPFFICNVLKLERSRTGGRKGMGKRCNGHRLKK